LPIPLEPTTLEVEDTRLRHIVDALPAYIAYVDHRLHYVMANHTYEEWFGRSAEEIVGRSVADVTGPSYENIRGHLEGALAGMLQRFETNMRTVEGDRVLSVIHIPDRDQEGRVRGVIIHGHDVTERKRQDALLVQSEKLAAVGRLASSIAHEINNPLEAVVNLLYLIEQTVPEGETRTYALAAQAELARVSQITTQTLRFFRQSTAPTLCHPAELIDSVLALYQGRLLNSGVRVRRSTRGDVKGLVYESEIRQVLNNLLSNALDAMRDQGGVLTVRARCAESPVTGLAGFRISVADTGGGMSPETLSHIFEPFFTTKGLQGTGLGLWVSSQIVEKQGGSLRVKSNRNERGHGTVFSLFIPFTDSSQH
jgi:PAS domain S-box-containing protein